MLDMENLILVRAFENKEPNQMSLMEAVSAAAEENTVSNYPKCACHIVAPYARKLNDVLDFSDRQWMKQYIPQLVSSMSSGRVATRRIYMLADGTVRFFLPIIFVLDGGNESAQKVRKLPEIVDRVTARRVSDTVYSCTYAGMGAEAKRYASQGSFCASYSASYENTPHAYMAGYVADYATNIIGAAFNSVASKCPEMKAKLATAGFDLLEKMLACKKG